VVFTLNSVTVQFISLCTHTTLVLHFLRRNQQVLVLSHLCRRTHYFKYSLISAGNPINGFPFHLLLNLMRVYEI